MWAVSNDGQSHRIVSMHLLGQMLWPVLLPILTKFPYVVHQCLVSLIYLAIGLSMVRWSPNLPYAHKLTKLSDDTAFKVGPLVTQELGWCTEDQDVILPQKLSNSFHSLMRGHVCYDMFCKMVTQKTKSLTTFRGQSIVVSMFIKSTCMNSKSSVTMMGHMGTLAWMPSFWMHPS